jgi:cephalosporin hydroxylase
MKITIDTLKKKIAREDDSGMRSLDLYSKEGFELLSEIWLKVGWNEKYSYSFTWFGRPIIQLPEDMVRTQEVIYRVRPDVIVETGVAHGGSLIFYASLLKAMDGGRVIGVDIHIKSENRSMIAAHPLASSIDLIEGDSAADDVVSQVRQLMQPGQKVLVILDSDHSRAHVKRELEAYAPLVTVGSYIVATDGVMRDLDDVPRGDPEWKADNPATAAAEFAATHPEFVLEQPPRAFNESTLERNITYWPGAWLRRAR